MSLRMIGEIKALVSRDRLDAFFERKIAIILKSIGWGQEKSELSWEQNFYIFQT